jgi:GrpB-like predicted nucleotidyltransferase (UPF0157 family)
MGDSALEILEYETLPAACLPYDPAAAQVARLVSRFVEDRVRAVCVEHVGSSAAPGCAGKGVIDLAVLYENGDLVRVRDAIDGLGFQRQTNRDPFPEERPLRQGAVEYEGKRYRLHLHVIEKTSPEVDELRFFRDCLRADAELRRVYSDKKRSLIKAGVTDPMDYAIAKGEFVRECLGK